MNTKTYCGCILDSSFRRPTECSPKDGQCDYCELQDAEKKIIKLTEIIAEAQELIIVGAPIATVSESLGRVAKI